MPVTSFGAVQCLMQLRRNVRGKLALVGRRPRVSGVLYGESTIYRQRGTGHKAG